MSAKFDVDPDDPAFLLRQIEIGERHAAGDLLRSIIGQNAALLPDGRTSALASFAAAMAHATQVGADTITLKTIAMSSLHADDVRRVRGDQISIERRRERVGFP